MSQPTEIQVVGHGGAAAFYPGNTERSIRKALEIGVDLIEVDVRVSADRELVLLHDDQFQEDSGERLASQTSYADLRARFPSLIRLRDAFEIIDGAVPLMIDIKGRGYEPEIVELLREENSRIQSTASSTHARSLRQLHLAYPDMALGLSRGHSMTKYPFSRYKPHAGAAVSGFQVAPIVSLAQWCGASALMLQYHLCNIATVAIARKFGYRLYPWTVDDPKYIKSMVDLGVDGIISNRPDLVKEALARQASK